MCKGRASIVSIRRAKPPGDCCAWSCLLGNDIIRRIPPEDVHTTNVRDTVDGEVVVLIVGSVKDPLHHDRRGCEDRYQAIQPYKVLDTLHRVLWWRRPRQQSSKGLVRRHRRKGMTTGYTGKKASTNLCSKSLQELSSRRPTCATSTPTCYSY